MRIEKKQFVPRCDTKSHSNHIRHLKEPHTVVPTQITPFKYHGLLSHIEHRRMRWLETMSTSYRQKGFTISDNFRKRTFQSKVAYQMVNVEMLSLEFGRSPDNIVRMSQVQCSKLTHQCSPTIDQYTAKPFEQYNKYHKHNTHDVTAKECGLRLCRPNPLHLCIRFDVRGHPTLSAQHVVDGQLLRYFLER